jgi:hypothetical protein
VPTYTKALLIASRPGRQERALLALGPFSHPSSKGEKEMKKRHMDAMALVQTYGKPDIFLTMTCNPNWQEI